ncbi:glycosyltransferase family 2 protein [Humibacillus xanthopallidus]|uniref:Galactosyltransferase-like protein n=1 Tax=Humibacillus xanthopallidus TaxID=412689 RepID=A0A543HJV1_9MICO|nr:galactosyltransferase-related protein [Humibacillus xanthopallidus]TQM58616.1 galactosyltransferase-like protein [Humibacillus xanthopallidus]
MTGTGSAGVDHPAPRTALLTLAHGRHHHLEGLLLGLGAGSVLPDHLVVVAMDDAQIASVVTEHTPAGLPAEVLSVDAHRWGLPLATARNRAAERAIAAGAELLVFLDVDCIPGPRLVERYREAARSATQGSTDVWSGAVHYLPPRLAGRPYSAVDLEESRPHAARPVAPEDGLLAADDLRLFWSLSFAVSASTWQCVGGFDEGYDGYGGEDTDFAMKLARADGRLWWVGGAPAYHQHHEVESPPRRHLVDIVRNSNRFAMRWGWFPMEGWLAAFADEGLITLAGRTPRWHLTAAGHRAARRP